MTQEYAEECYKRRTWRSVKEDQGTRTEKIIGKMKEKITGKRGRVEQGTGLRRL